jgi:large subunit ribosomal protein L16
MFEIDGVPWNLAQEAFLLAAAKLPLDTKIVRRLGDSE